MCRLATVIANDVKVFYSFPMLGLAVLKAHLAGRGSELLNLGAGETEKASAAMEAVIRACHLQSFMDLLAAPSEELCKELLYETMDVVGPIKVQPPRTSKLGSLKQREWMQRLAADAVLLKKLASSSSKGAHCPQKREVLDRQVRASLKPGTSIQLRI